MDVGAGQGQPYSVDGETLATLMAAEETRPLALSLIKANQEANQDTQASRGRYVTEQGNDGSIWQRDTMTGEQQIIREAPQQAEQYRMLSPQEAQQMGLPAGAYQVGADNKISPIGGSNGTNVTVNNTETPAFFKTLDEQNAKTFSSLLDAGAQAQGNEVRLAQLETELASAPQGMQGSLVQLAGRFGVPMDGLDNVQAAQALINQLVPGQRQPGSGTMSDADLALFKQSLPSIANQPGGNERILKTMRSINAYTMQQAQIANDVANRVIDPGEGRKRLMALLNPLAGIKAPPASAGNGNRTPDLAVPDAGSVARPVTKEDYEALPSGAKFVDPEDGKTYRKP